VVSECFTPRLVVTTPCLEVERERALRSNYVTFGMSHVFAGPNILWCFARITRSKHHRLDRGACGGDASIVAARVQITWDQRAGR